MSAGLCLILKRSYLCMCAAFSNTCRTFDDAIDIGKTRYS
jgi:hypothetical protein